MYIIESFQPYIDKWGFVEPNLSFTGNGQLYTAEYIIALEQNGALFPEEKERLKWVYDATQLEEGLMMRDPANSIGQNSIDNYLGCAVASYYLYSPNDQNSLAKRILNYGSKHFYYYPNAGQTSFDAAAFLGRFQAMFCIMKWAANEEPSLLQKTALCIALLQSAFSKEDDWDRYILAWLSIKVAENKSWLVDRAISFWKKKKAGMSINRVLASYFGNLDHPLVKWLHD